ncbi:MAG: hypothetical protein IAI50_18700 [Candidatus Eremiobacteraeota bacterium]|nr:hypothetical protein [Candidatus Eremiobacteraeota bacterium]
MAEIGTVLVRKLGNNESDDCSSGENFMTTATSIVDWNRIERFIGFGRLDAPVVFIGMEEGLKSREGLESDLAIRSAYEGQIMDLKQAHRGIADADVYFDPELATIQRTWRVMADLMLRREGNLNPSTSDRRRYQALRLGRGDGDTLLTELLPYPSPGVKDWLYARFGHYATREVYMADVLPRRLEMLGAVLAAEPRELVVCYGKAHWPHYEALFKNVSWHDEGVYRVAEHGKCRVVLTPHFVSSAFNSNADLASFAGVALPGRAL